VYAGDFRVTAAQILQRMDTRAFIREQRVSNAQYQRLSIRQLLSSLL
jgi:hypothetical protein